VPHVFLQQALTLPWNQDKRAIDPSFVLIGDQLHCFFVGSDGYLKNSPNRANLLGHAITTDPQLQDWKIISQNQPLMGRNRAADGVENVTIYKIDGLWTMMFSEGLVNQHLAIAQSTDLFTWNHLGPVQIEKQKWLTHKYGAPFVWQEANQYFMVLMGEENNTRKTTLGLFQSTDGLHWLSAPEYK